jgi:hypothetical protein
MFGLLHLPFIPHHIPYNLVLVIPCVRERSPIVSLDEAIILPPV